MEKADHHAQEAEVREHYYDPLSELAVIASRLYC
jgi:hypothetical protein